MNEYKCRIKANTRKWVSYNAGHPSIAAQLYAEDAHALDGDVVTVMNNGKYRVERRVVIHKEN